MALNADVKLDASPQGTSGSAVPPEEAARPVTSRILVDEEELRTRIIDECRELFEPQLIEREARLIPVVLNLIQYARPWRAERDARSSAAIKAILWRVFSPSTILLTGGLATLFISVATLILLAQQNERLDQQTYVTDAGRSASLVSELGSVMAAITAYADSVCVPTRRAGAERRCWADYAPPFRPDFVAKYRRAAVSEGNRAVRQIDFFSSQIAPTVGADDGRPPVLPLPPQLQGRLSVLVNALRPYKYLNFSDSAVPLQYNAGGWLKMGLNLLLGSFEAERPQLSPRAVSPERGLLLASLVQLGVNLEAGFAYTLSWEYAYIEMPRFRDVWLRGRNFGYSSFRCGDFSGANLSFSSFKSADLHGAQFSGEGTDLNAVSFQDADLTRAKFLAARLPRARHFKDADLQQIDLHEATTTEGSLLEILRANARSFDASAWRLIPVKPSSRNGLAKSDTDSPLFRVEHVSGQQLGLAPTRCR